MVTFRGIMIKVEVYQVKNFEKNEKFKPKKQFVKVLSRKELVNSRN